MRQACFHVLDKREDLMNILLRYTDFLGLLVNTIRLDNFYLHFLIFLYFIVLYFTMAFIYLKYTFYLYFF
jgi:hypothetical protein